VTAGLNGKVALVTGGGTGIGAAVTARLADEGVSVLLGQRTEEKAERCARELRRGARVIEGFGADLATAAGCIAIVSECIRRYGRIDLLINNAGITGPGAVGPFLEFTDAHLDEVIDVNLKAAFRCGREAARHMVTTGGGVIVNISSVGAYAAQHHAVAYVASKAGLTGLTKGMGFELAAHGVRVVAIAPGDIDVSGGPPNVAAPVHGNSQRDDWWLRRTPLGGRGQPEDIASVVAFMCSDGARFITGETLIVDGGWLSY
jgi:NAD(P)-dependent dehydrogenase (short-subunit alcohol dehydrogenase family)